MWREDRNAGRRLGALQAGFWERILGRSFRRKNRAVLAQSAARLFYVDNGGKKMIDAAGRILLAIKCELSELLADCERNFRRR